jgi:hypothetical protein
MPDEASGLRKGKFGIPLVCQVILSMASLIFGLFRSLLVKHGYRDDSPQGFLAMQQEILQFESTPEVSRLLAEIVYTTCFGYESKVKDQPEIQARYAFMIFLAFRNAHTNVMASHWHYLNHLGLQPLQRFLLSVPRTIAWVERLFHERLKIDAQMWKHHQKMKGNNVPAQTVYDTRCYWIISARDDLEGRLAREGMFEDVMAFKDSPDATIILLGDWFTGTWPQGNHVQVYGFTWQDTYLSRNLEITTYT